MNKLNIKRCKVPIALREEFINVTRICLDSGLTWFDDDDSYDCIDGDNKILVVCESGDQFLYDTSCGYESKEEVSYKGFISKYGKQNKKEVIQMKIEPNKVIINSEEEFNNVARICLNNGYTWGDSDDTYNSIRGSNKAIIVEDSDDKEILYVMNTGFNEYEDITYASFMTKYSSVYINKVNKMKIEQCRVKITSREEFDKVSNICLVNGVKWYHKEEDKYDTVCGDIKVLTVDDDYELLFIGYDTSSGYEYMTFKEFMDKYDKGITDKIITLTTKLNETLFKKKRPTLNQTM